MPSFLAADRVKESSTSTGTGNIALAGAATGFRTFNATVGVGPYFVYAIVHQTANEWEVGVGYLSASTTLVRNTLISSNSGSTVSFSAGTKDVFITQAANLNANKVNLGTNANILGSFATSVGNATNTTGDYSTAVGYSTTASGIQSTAVGYGTQATGASAIAIGFSAQATAAGATSIGNSASASIDAIALGTIASAAGNSAFAAGYSASASGQYNIAIGYDATASNDSTIAQGFLANAADSYGVAIGRQAYSQNNYAVALGFQTSARSEGTVAIGQQAQVSTGSGSEYSVAIGYGANANPFIFPAQNSLALGRNAAVRHTNAIAIGYFASAGDIFSSAGYSSVAIGDSARSYADGGVALGANAYVDSGHTQSVVLGFATSLASQALYVRYIRNGISAVGTQYSLVWDSSTYEITGTSGGGGGGASTSAACIFLANTGGFFGPGYNNNVLFISSGGGPGGWIITYTTPVTLPPGVGNYPACAFVIDSPPTNPYWVQCGMSSPNNTTIWLYDSTNTQTYPPFGVPVHFFAPTV